MSSNGAISLAIAVMRQHADALNTHDEEKLARTLHFPHFRMSGTSLQVWKTPESYFSDFRERAGSTWARSDFPDIQVVGMAGDKVHLDVKVARYDHAGNEITTFRSLWIITRENGIWAAKFRSSFAPV